MTDIRKVALITGAARGLGRAYAHRFARDGYAVVVADLNGPQAESVRDELTAAGGTAIATPTDVSVEASANECVAESLAAFGRIDVLINNAAISADLRVRPFWEIGVEEWDRVVGVNMRGTWLMMKAVTPAMVAQRSGSIINVSSNTFTAGRPGFLHYVGSKGAVIGMTRAAARELGEYNIRVNCILPGLTMTEVPDQPYGAARFEELLKSQSLKRVEVPADLVGTAAFLASDDSLFMTGQGLTVDGGNVFH